MVCSTVSTLIVVAAVAVLISHLLLPILRIYGSSMTPTLADGDIVAAVRNGSYERGNVIAFYYNNKIYLAYSGGDARGYLYGGYRRAGQCEH